MAGIPKFCLESIRPSKKGPIDVFCLYIRPTLHDNFNYRIDQPDLTVHFMIRENLLQRKYARNV